MGTISGTTVRRRMDISTNSVCAEPLEEPNVSSTYDGHTPAAKLWLQSRMVSNNPLSYRDKGTHRPFSVRNIRIAVQLINLVGLRFFALFMKGQQWRMLLYLGNMMVQSVLPTIKIWASSRLLDMVQASFETGGSVDQREVLRVGLLVFISSGGTDILRSMARKNNLALQSHVNNVLVRTYLDAQLSLSIPASSSTHISALMFEAGQFAGHERGGMGAPFQNIQLCSSLLTTLLGALSQIALIVRTLTNNGPTSSGISWSSLLLIGLSVTPSLLRTLLKLLRSAQPNLYQRDWVSSEITNMGRSAAYKQELVLFGLKDWMLEKWDETRKSVEEGQQSRHGVGSVDVAIGMVEEGVQTGFYVLLALRVIPTSLTLGSIRLYQKTVESLLRVYQSLSSTFDHAFQIIFLVAAYVEAVDIHNHARILRPSQYTDVIDYEAHRRGGGMEIIASNMSFRYPGSDKDVLTDINLHIKPGTTLALVGFNGGGKTTLIKALMGLYDHRGSLLLNGLPIEAFDPATIHKRTSCLFQDFCKYSFTLRENVGLGNIGRMQEDDVVVQAMRDGGMEQILEKVGLEGKLSRSSVLVDKGEGGIQIKTEPLTRGGRAVRQIATRNRAWVAELRLSSRWSEVGWKLWEQIGSGIGYHPMRSDANVVLEGKSASGDRLPAPTTSTKIFPSAPAVPITSVSTTISTTESAAGTHETPVAPVLPGAQDHPVETRASLSGGQWQRVALARAFMRAGEADLVVFDEPSASLDPRAEAELFDRIHALSKDEKGNKRCTTIYISHRFSTVRKADQIAVVENGTIVECGPHAELMAKKGRYAELYNLQKAGFED